MPKNAEKNRQILARTTAHKKKYQTCAEKFQTVPKNAECVPKNAEMFQRFPK